MFYYEDLEVGRNFGGSNILFLKQKEFHQAPKCETPAQSHPKLISGWNDYEMGKWD